MKRVGICNGLTSKLQPCKQLVKIGRPAFCHGHNFKDTRDRRLSLVQPITSFNIFLESYDDLRGEILSFLDSDDHEELAYANKEHFTAVTDVFKRRYTFIDNTDARVIYGFNKDRLHTARWSMLYVRVPMKTIITLPFVNLHDRRNTKKQMFAFGPVFLAALERFGCVEAIIKSKRNLKKKKHVHLVNIATVSK